jgi:hypothetical protein
VKSGLEPPASRRFLSDVSTVAEVFAPQGDTRMRALEKAFLR